MEKVYDCVIIGGGPAGYSAALYAARAGLEAVVIEKMSIGGQMTLTETIDNYPGFDGGVDGFTLGEKMKKGAERFGATTKVGTVKSVELEGKIKKIELARETLYSRTVIIATGADHKELGIENEKELVGRGVSYCAHCDANFFRGKTVAVIGGGNSAVSDAMILSRVAQKVYLIHRRDTLRATKIYHTALENAQNVELCFNSTVKKLHSDFKLNAITVSDKDGNEKELELDGVFISIGRNPATELFKNQLELDSHGYIVADESTRTSIEGVFAAGDVRTKALRQVITAAADGATAASFAEEYIVELGDTI